MSDSRKAVIEQKVRSLGPGAYQNLLEAYLKKKHGYKNIMPLGTHTGTDKTTRGTPDSIVRAENGKFILINYGTVETNAYAKIRDDIFSCLNEKKTKISENDIEQIVCCHTSTNLNAGQLKELFSLFRNIELVGISDLAYDLLDQYQMLAYDHLQIELSTRQILNEDDFIEECDKNPYSTTLAMPLLCRDNEIADLFHAIESNPLVLLSGPSGFGKTRLAMEVARKYAEKHGAVLRYIKPNSLPIFHDLIAEFSKSNQYIVVVDDANRLDQIDLLLNLITDKEYTIKLLLTARDYTKNKLLNDLHRFLLATEYTLNPLSDDSIAHILNDNLEIENHSLQRHILKIAKGNIRIAIMAGVCVKSGRYSDVENIFELLRNYYSPIISELDPNEILVASIIAFYDAFMVEENSFPVQLASSLGIDEGQFIDCCYNLEEKEVIARRERHAVKFDNQNLQDYFLYYAFYEAKILSPSEIIISSFNRYQSRVIYTFNTLIHLFASADLMEYLETEVRTAWAQVKNTPSLIDAFLEAFVQVIPNETLLHVRQTIRKLPVVQQDLSVFDFQKDAHHEIIQSKTLSYMSQLRKCACFSDAIDLVIEYFERNNEHPMDFYHLIRKEWSYSYHLSQSDYFDEHIILDKLIENFHQKQNLPSALLLYFALLGFSRYSFDAVEASSDNSISFSTFVVLPSDYLLSLREKSISSLAEMFSIPAFNALAIKVLLHGFTLSKYQYDKEVVQHDIDALRKHLFPLIDIRQFNHCVMLEHIEKLCEIGSIPFPAGCQQSVENPVYATYKQLKKNWDYVHDEEARVASICKLAFDTPTSVFVSLWNDLQHGIEDSNHKWSLSQNISTLFFQLKNDKEKFLACFHGYVECEMPGLYHCSELADNLIDVLGWKGSLDLIHGLNFSTRNQMIAAIYDRADLTALDRSALDEIMLIAADSSISYGTVVGINTSHPGYIADYLVRLTENAEVNPTAIINFWRSMRRDSEDAAEITLLLCENIEILYAAVLLTIRKIPHADIYAHDLLLHLIRQDKSFLSRVIKELRSNEHHNNEFLLYDEIWNLDSYEEYITIAVQALEESSSYAFSSDTMLEQLVTTKRCSSTMRAKKIAWQSAYIAENCTMVTHMSYLFHTLCLCPKEQYKEALIVFCKHNNDFEAFKQLPLLPSLSCWSGSEVPHIERNLQYLTELRTALAGVDFLEHRIHISDRIQRLRQYKEYRITQEFLERC